MSFAGLRGAVGIALALLLSAETMKYSNSNNISDEQRQQYQFYVDKLFGMAGGISFLTLVINAPAVSKNSIQCEPLLFSIIRYQQLCHYCF